MSTFVGARQASDENLAIATGYGILDRSFRKKLGMKVPKYKALSLLRQLEGKMRPAEVTSRHEFYHHEEGDWFNTSVTIAAANNGVAGQTTITLSAADHYEAGARSYPTVGQLAVFENEVVGYVFSIDRANANAHTAVIKNINPSNNVQAAAIIGSTVSFYGNVFAEVDVAEEMHVPVTSKVTNYIHKSSKTYRVTDFAAQNETEFEYDGQKYLYVKGIDETADRFAMEEELNLIITPLSASLTNAGGKALQTANALIPQITDNGQTFEYADGVDMATFDDMVLLINDNYGDTEYMIGQGINLSLSMKNWLVDFSKNGDNNVSFNYFDGGKEQALKFDFTGVMIGGIDFYFSRWEILSHKGSLGAGNMPYRHMGIAIPCGNTKDPQSGDMMPYMQLRYSKPQGAAHEVQGDIKVFETGGTAKRGATEKSQRREITMVSYKSLQINNREKFVIMRKSA
jgi:hypothetical protein